MQIKGIENDEGDKVFGMKDFQMVVSDFPAGGEIKTGKYVSTVGTTDELVHEIYSNSKTKVTACYIYDNQRVTGLKIEQYKSHKKEWVYEKEMANLSVKDTNLLASFLEFLQTENIGELKPGNFKLSMMSQTLSNATIEQVVEIVQNGGMNPAIINSIIEYGVTDRDVVGLGFRRKQLEIFDKLLNEEGFIEAYKSSEEGLSEGTTEEKVFQYFLHKNAWIFGFGLDYKYLGILAREGTVGGPVVGGQEQAIVDFITACSKYTVLVELKKPSDSLFRGTTTQRSGSRGLSTSLIDAVGQILEYKASAQVFLNDPNNCFDRDGEEFQQKTVDPKCILLIGRDSDFDIGTPYDKKVKERTFELFRRDSRNIEIYTYDEIYNRAKFIVDGTVE